MGVKYYSSETDKEKYIYFKKDFLLQPNSEFHDSVEMIFMLEGEAEAHLNGQTYLLTKGDVFFVDSYEGHWYKFITESVLAYVLVLSREYLRNFYELYSGQTFVTYMNDKEKNVRIFELIEKWFLEEEKTHIKDLGYANVLFSYFVESYPPVKRAQKNDKDEFIVKLLLYIHEHYLEDLNLNKVAKELGYSADHCSRVIKKYAGRDFREYVNMLRIKKANALLADKSVNMTTLEILYKCGFQSAATYYRAKKHFDNERKTAEQTAKNTDKSEE